MEYRLKHFSDFNAVDAQYEDWYELQRKEKPGLFTRGGWVTIEEDENGPDMGPSFVPLKGDRAWAERIAKHYKIKVPKEDA